MTTVQVVDGNTVTVKKSFETLSEAQAFVQSMIESGDYALNDFAVIKGVVVTALIELAEETP